MTVYRFCRVEPLGRAVVTLDFRAPAETGAHTLAAELTDGDETVRSLRDFAVKAPGP